MIREIIGRFVIVAIAIQPLQAAAQVGRDPFPETGHVGTAGCASSIPPTPAAASTCVTRIPPPELASGRLVEEVAREAMRLEARDGDTAAIARTLRWQEAAPEEGWIGQHPVAFGALIGLAAGFTIGYAAGDDGIFYDFTAGFNGLVLGGVGAGVGAIIGSRW
jgi:hypothetical protein